MSRVPERIVVPVTSESGSAPVYGTEVSSGADLLARISAPVKLASLERTLIPTGLFLAIPPGYEGQVRPRSGLALKRGITVLNSPGTIDADYRGELKVIIVNLSADAVTIEPGERVAQLVFAPVVQADFQIVDTLDETVRGAGGFGSTGV